LKQLELNGERGNPGRSSELTNTHSQINAKYKSKRRRRRRRRRRREEKNESQRPFSPFLYSPF